MTCRWTGEVRAVSEALLRWGGGSRLIAKEGAVQMARASSVKIASSRRPGSVSCLSS